MGGIGISLPPLLGIVTSSSQPSTVGGGATGGASNGGGAGTGPWTPPQNALPALTILTVPASSGGSGAASSAVNYVFDAVMRVIHRRSLHKTQHPVITGANIADHAYVMPARVSLEIGMSDSMAAYTAGVWVGAATKSVSAWQILKGLQLNRTLLTLTTRLDTYSQLLIVELEAPDDNKTLRGLKATVTLEEIVAGSVASQPSTSARPQTSGITSNGVVQSQPVNSSQAQQNVVPSTAFPNTLPYPQVPGAGLDSAGPGSYGVSSNSLGQANE
jgi:hypothetical protein